MPKDYPKGWEPTDAIMRNLALRSQGLSFDEEEVQDASLLLIAFNLVVKGIEFDLAVEMVESIVDSGATIQASYSPDEGLQITLKRDDEAGLE